MIDPLLDARIEELGLNVVRPEPSDSDEEVLELSKQHEAPIVTRDRDFVERHRHDEKHFGILFDPGMHHRPTPDVLEAVKSVIELMSQEDLEDTVVRLKRFY